MADSLIERLHRVADVAAMAGAYPEAETIREAATRLREAEVELAGSTAAYERMTEYQIVHEGVLRYCSDGMREAYSDMKVRAEQAEAERDRLRAALLNAMAAGLPEPVMLDAQAALDGAAGGG